MCSTNGHVQDNCVFILNPEILLTSKIFILQFLENSSQTTFSHTKKNFTGHSFFPYKKKGFSVSLSYSFHHPDWKTTIDIQCLMLSCLQTVCWLWLYVSTNSRHPLYIHTHIKILLCCLPHQKSLYTNYNESLESNIPNEKYRCIMRCLLCK